MHSLIHDILYNDRHRAAMKQPTQPQGIQRGSQGAEEMVTFVKDRQIDPSKVVRVYRNLNNGKMSVQQNGKVVCYADSVLLKNASFKVSESSRQRVLNTKQRNVHAYAIGELIAFNTAANFDGQDISYNPYYAGFFYYKHDKSEVITKNKMLYCGTDRVHIEN